MDAFFAACEERKNPELKKKPLVIGADPKNGAGRGVVSTANYMARRYGIHSAMPIRRAYKLNPDANFIKPNFSLYTATSREIMKILKSYSGRFQQVSIDEAYLDITDYAKNFVDAKIFALRIKNEIFEKIGLTCSIGIANNKIIAKIASDHNKPDGLTVIHGNENKSFLDPLSVRKLYGIGPKTEYKLHNIGIKSIGQLADYSKEKLIDIFGVYGLYLHLSANGHGSDFVAEEYGRVSIGKERTFFNDVQNFDELDKNIDKISDAIFEDLEENGYLFRTVSIKIRMHDYKTFTRAKTLHTLRCDKDSISNTAKELSREFYGDKIRLMGIRVSNLEELDGQKKLEDYVYA
jgi:DNA polymerase IV (archaeal DinB-like DNA polymerase)